MKKLFFVPAVSTLFLLASCGGGSGSNESAGTTTTPSDNSKTAAATTTTEAPGASIAGIDTVAITDHIKLEGRDDMTYNKTLFKVKAGQKITLDFKNVGKLPAASMSHDVTILKPGTDVQTFGTAAVSAPAPDHIPPSMKDAVIAHTKMLGSGQSDQITFTLPAPGVYDFICTFPGHFETMHGRIVVEP